MHSTGDNQQCKKQPTEWERLFQIIHLIKGLLSRIYQWLKIMSLETNVGKTWAGGLYKQFNKEET